MPSSSSDSELSWLARLLIGAAGGSIAGAVYLTPDWTLKGLLAASLAGAVSFSIIGALHGLWAKSTWIFLLICSVAGGFGGYAWSTIQSTSWKVSIILGVIIGFLWPAIEIGIERLSEKESTD